MLNIRDHGGTFVGGKSYADFIPKNFTALSISNILYLRLQIANSFALIRRDNQVHTTVDLATGTVIAATTATSASGSLDLPFPVADENDDYIYGSVYQFGTNDYKPRAVNKNVQKVWEANIVSTSENGVLTKDFLFLKKSGTLYKFRRSTGEVFSFPNTDIGASEQFVFGNTENDSQIIYFGRSKFAIIDTITGATVKSGTLPEVFANSSANPWGAALKDGLLHFVTYNSSNYEVYHWIYPADATVFNSTTRLATRKAPGTSWENGNFSHNVRNTKSGVTIATNYYLELVNMKVTEKSLKISSLMEPNLYRVNGNGVNYINITISNVLSAYGSYKR